MIKTDGDFSIVRKETLEFFNQYKKKAVFNVVLVAKPLALTSYQITRGVTHTNTVEVFDTRLDEPFLTGSLSFNGEVYSVQSDRIKNARFGTYNSNHRVKVSKDMPRAAKFASEYLRPFTWEELAETTETQSRNALLLWVGQPSRAIYDATQQTLRHTDIQDLAEEALERGLRFKNAKINAAIECVSNNREEAQRRSSLKLRALFVAQLESGLYCSTAWPSQLQEHELHPEVAARIALLRLTNPSRDASNSVPEVGYRQSERKFWLFLPIDVISTIEGETK